MTSLVTCSYCGKKFSRKAPKCPNCGAKYLICSLCWKVIAPNECFRTVPTLDVFDSVKEESNWTYIHLSCLEPYFSSPKQVKCPDCGKQINCPNFSLEDFTVQIHVDPPFGYLKSPEWKKALGVIKTLVVHCSNCGNPDTLGINMLRNYRIGVDDFTLCLLCQLLIIPAIHKYTITHSGVYHSFCHYDTTDKTRQRKEKGWFRYWFGG